VVRSEAPDHRVAEIAVLRKTTFAGQGTRVIAADHEPFVAIVESKVSAQPGN
jgi:hypothetical protein